MVKTPGEYFSNQEIEQVLLGLKGDDMWAHFWSHFGWQSHIWFHVFCVNDHGKWPFGANISGTVMKHCSKLPHTASS